MTAALAADPGCYRDVLGSGRPAIWVCLFLLLLAWSSVARAGSKAESLPVGDFLFSESAMLQHFITIGRDLSYKTATLGEGPLERSGGVVQMSGGRLLLSPPAFGTLAELEHVVWGEQHYLVEPRGLATFCTALRQLVNRPKAVVQAPGTFGRRENGKKAHPQTLPKQCPAESAPPAEEPASAPDKKCSTGVEECA